MWPLLYFVHEFPLVPFLYYLHPAANTLEGSKLGQTHH